MFNEKFDLNTLNESAKGFVEGYNHDKENLHYGRGASVEEYSNIIISAINDAAKNGMDEITVKTPKIFDETFERFFRAMLRNNGIQIAMNSRTGNIYYWGEKLLK